MAFVHSRLTDSRIPKTLRQEALNRIFSDPGIPDRTSTTVPFWLKDSEGGITGRQSDNLPSEADIVIIGSGITGTSVAYSLLHAQAIGRSDDSGKQASCQAKVVMLEARDLCSGATGRNGGHILQTCEEYVDFKEMYGQASAETLIRFRLAHLDALLKVADDLGLSTKCQARKVQFLSVFFDEDTWEDAKQRISTFKLDMPEEAASFGTVNAAELKKSFYLPTARGAVYGTAGAIWPYKFVTGVLQHLLERFPAAFDVEANTAVTEILGGVGNYNVVTERGIIHCKHVVHCTNAHIGHLIPSMNGRIYPLRGQMSAQTPGEKLPNMGHKHSWLFNYTKGYDYLTQIPGSDSTSDGEMMLGGGFVQAKGFGTTEIGVATDSDLNGYIDDHLRGALGTIFGRENWPSAAGPAVKSMWTGNMGFSADGMPWVGRLPESVTHRSCVSSSMESPQKCGAEWIAAAFSGEGMVHAWLCGAAVATMLLRHEGYVESHPSSNSSQLLPEPMLMSEQRYREAAIPRHLPGTE